VIDFESHKDKLEKALAIKNPLTDKNCVDKIEEKLWLDNVIPALNEISIETVDELQDETKGYYPKDSTLTDSNGNIVYVKTIEELEKVSGKLAPNVVPLRMANGDFYGFQRKLRYSEAPPTRLLSLALNLCYRSSGDHEMHKKNEGGIGVWERIEQAYKSGFNSNLESKFNQANARTSTRI
jgi:hypothetical protein